MVKRKLFSTESYGQDPSKPRSSHSNTGIRRLKRWTTKFYHTPKTEGEQIDHRQKGTLPGVNGSPESSHLS